MEKKQQTPKYIFILFALGQLGWSLTCFAVCNCVTYFYSPPIHNGVPEIPTFINNISVFGLFTLLGAIVLCSFIPDALSNFIVASKSDNDTSAFGKRRKYMSIGIIPFALFAVLVFIPITATASWINALWFCFCLFAFYISWSFYLTPYNAMINDLGHSSQERLTINTYISVTWAIGFLAGNSVYALKGFFQNYFSKLQSFQLSVLIFSIIGFVLMLIPIIFIDEKKYCKTSITPEKQEKNLWKAIVHAFRNKNFAYFLTSDTIYWLASNTISVCLVFYVVSLLKLDESFTSIIGLVILIGSFLTYVPINFLSKSIGKKRLQQFSYIMLSISFGMLFFLGQVDLPYWLQLLCIGLVIIFPLASFGILPNAILSDLVEYKKEKDGEYHAALYFSIKTVMMKLGVHFSNFILFALIPIGRGTSNIGIRGTALVAMIAAIAGLLVFSQYNEQEVLLIQNKTDNE